MSTLPETEPGEITQEFTADVAPEAPKRRGRQPYPRDPQGNIIRPDGTIKKASSTSRIRGSLENQIGGFLAMWNAPCQMFVPKYALSPIEIEALAKSLDQQCQVSPRFRRYVETMLKSVGGVSLIGVIAVIVGRRVVRADLIPIPAESPVTAQQIDGMLESILAMSMAKPPLSVVTAT